MATPLSHSLQPAKLFFPRTPWIIIKADLHLDPERDTKGTLFWFCSILVPFPDVPTHREAFIPGPYLLLPVS